MPDSVIMIASKPFQVQDIIALIWFFIWAGGYSYYADHHRKSTPSIVDVMNRYRVQWMMQMMKRDNRMVDSTSIGNLLRSIAFFASTSIFILAGLMTLLGYYEEGKDFISNLPYSDVPDPHSWKLRIALLVAIFIYAFFKHTWSLRQHNYANILVGAAPLPTERKEMHDQYARMVGMVAGNAARHFNMGLRAYYFGLAALAWFIHPYVFMAVTSWVVFVMWRREFFSRSLRALIRGMDETERNDLLKGRKKQ